MTPTAKTAATPAETTKSLAARALRVARSGVVPADDQHIIADLVAGLEARDAFLPAAAPQWQDIALAPKDGTYILLAGTDTSRRPYRHVGRWAQTSFLWGLPGYEYLNEPTHFMPLPAPPSTTGSGETGNA